MYGIYTPAELSFISPSHKTTSRKRWVVASPTLYLLQWPLLPLVARSLSQFQPQRPAAGPHLYSSGQHLLCPAPAKSLFAILPPHLPPPHLSPVAGARASDPFPTHARAAPANGASLVSHVRVSRSTQRAISLSLPPAEEVLQQPELQVQSARCHTQASKSSIRGTAERQSACSEAQKLRG